MTMSSFAVVLPLGPSTKQTADRSAFDSAKLSERPCFGLFAAVCQDSSAALGFWRSYGLGAHQ
jgi:hypothetical protein